jgi:hypothetical protein
MTDRELPDSRSRVPVRGLFVRHIVYRSATLFASRQRGWWCGGRSSVVERLTVAQEVAGSIPVAHPNETGPILIVRVGPFVCLMTIRCPMRGRRFELAAPTIFRVCCATVVPRRAARGRGVGGKGGGGIMTTRTVPTAKASRKTDRPPRDGSSFERATSTQVGSTMR